MAANKEKVAISNIEEVYNTWNETFPELNIRKVDLTNPTETFLLKIFVAYLRAFGYKVEPPRFEGGNAEKEKRIFLIIISRHIEKILQISVKSRTFTYFDLIKPAPKKTLKCLDILYNYLCYFNMYKHDVLGKASDLGQKYEDVQEKVNDLEREIVNRNDRKIEVKLQIESLQREEIELKPRLNGLRINIQKRNKDMMQLKNEVEELENQITRLNAQKQHYSNLIVSEKERKDLMMQIAKLQEDINASKQEIKQHEDILKERKSLIEANNLLCKSVTDMLEKLSPKDLAEYKENKSKLEKATKLHQTTKNNVKELKVAIEKQKVHLEILKKNIKTQKSQHEPEMISQQNLLKEKKTTLMECNKRLEDLVNVAHKLKTKIAEQDLIAENLYEGIHELFIAYN